MPRPPTFGNAVVRYFSSRLLPDPPAAGGRLTEYVTRNGLVIVALAALVLIGGAWYLFAGDKSAPGAGGPNAGRQPRRRCRHRASGQEGIRLRGRSARHAARQRVRRHHCEGCRSRRCDSLRRGPAGPQGRPADRARQHRGARRSRRSRGRRQRQPQSVQAQPGAVPDQGAVGSAARSIAGDAARERGARRRRALAARRSRHHCAVQRARRAAQREPRRTGESRRSHHDARRSQRGQARFLRAGAVPLHAAAGPDGRKRAAPRIRTPRSTAASRASTRASIRRRARSRSAR